MISLYENRYGILIWWLGELESTKFNATKFCHSWLGRSLPLIIDTMPLITTIVWGNIPSDKVYHVTLQVYAPDIRDIYRNTVHHMTGISTIIYVTV